MDNVPPPSQPPLITACQVVRFVLAIVGAFFVYHWAFVALDATMPLEPAFAAVGVAVLTVVGLKIIEITVWHRNMGRWIKQVKRARGED